MACGKSGSVVKRISMIHVPVEWVFNDEVVVFYKILKVKNGAGISLITYRH